MSSVFSIRSHTLINFEHVQGIIWPLRITKRTPYVYQLMIAHKHTLAYADVIRCSVTAL